MKLATKKRVAKQKTNELRREGNIPGIVYGKDQAGTPISVLEVEMQAILRNMKPGRLSTTIFELEGIGQAIVKEIQYHPATYQIEHIDFAILVDNQLVTLDVPVRLTGVADCAGVKLGGFVRQVVPFVKVNCLPKHIPQEFTIDVKDLVIGQSKTLTDIAFPAHVRPIDKLDQVAVVIGKKAGAA